MPENILVQREWAGINLSAPPHLIPENQLVLARNCYPVEPGSIGPRPRLKFFTAESVILGSPSAGYSTFGFASTLAGAVPPRFLLCRWMPRGKPAYAGFAYDKSLSGAPFNPARDTPPDGGTGWGFFTKGGSSTLFSRASQLQHPEYCGYRGALIISCQDFRPILLREEDWVENSLGPYFHPTDVILNFGSPPAQLMPRGMQPYRGQLVLWGDAQWDPSEVYFTDRGLTPGQLLAGVTVGTGTGLQVGMGTGDPIVTCRDLSLFGSAQGIEAVLLIFKQRSLWILQGTPPDSTTTGLPDCRVSRLLNEGLVHPRAICDTPYGVAWCSGQNVWLMPPGGQPQPIGNDIAAMLRTLPQNDASAWGLEWDAKQRCLRLQLPWAVGPITAFDPSTLYGFAHLDQSQLMCDLRNPATPQWWGPQVIPSRAMVAAPELQDVVAQLVMPSSFENAGTTLTVGHLARLNGADKTFDDKPFFTKGSGMLEISQWIALRQMDYGNPFIKKTVEGVDLEVDYPQRDEVPGGSNLQVYSSCDHTPTDYGTSLFASEAAGTAPSAEFILGINETEASKLDNVAIGLGARTIIQSFTPLSRQMGRRVQLQLISLQGTLRLWSLAQRINAHGRLPTGTPNSP